MGVKVWRLSMLSLHSFELRLSKSETVVPPMDVADYEAMYRGASIVKSDSARSISGSATP